MNIACISASQIPSASANSIQAMKVCQALTRLGNQVRLLVPRDKGANRRPVDWDQLARHYGLQTPFEVEWLPADLRFKRYDFAIAAARRARALKAELVYAWPLQAALLALINGFPVALELHGEPEGRLAPGIFWLITRLPGKKRYLPISRALAARLASKYKIAFKTGELVLAPNGVDLERYQDLPDPSTARRLLDLPERITAGISGHMYPGRGRDLVSELARCLPQVNFIWIGGEPTTVANWRSNLERQGIANLTLTGFVENSLLPLYQAACELLLMPYERAIAGSSGGNSVDYCSPMKMFEYMACSRAILSSDLPVIREVLSEANAVLCPPEDGPAWVEALSALVNDASRRETLAKRARQDVLAFTWQNRALRALDGFPARPIA